MSSVDPPAPQNNPKGGRPGVTHRAVADAVDAWVARTGKAPSVRELRVALGSTGSLSTLGRHLRDVLADRLLAGAEPDRDSPEAILIKALKPAMGILAAEAAGAAEDVIASGAKEADARIAAAEGLRVRAEARANTAELEQQLLQGQVKELDKRVSALTGDLADTRKDWQDALARETSASAAVSALEQSLSSVQAQRTQLEANQQVDRQAISGLKDELHRVNEQRETAEKALLQSQLERDAARATAIRLESALEKAEQRHLSTEKLVQDGAEQRSRLRDSVRDLTDQVAVLKTALAVAEASTAQLTQERDTLVVDQARWEKIQTLLAQLQKKR